MTDDSRETCPACGDPMPESCAGPSGRHQPIPAARPAEPTGELREQIIETLHAANPLYYDDAADELLSGPLAPLLARLQAVEALHVDFHGWCAGCDFAWPCQTRRALDAS